MSKKIVVADRVCKYCGKTFNRTKYPKGTLEFVGDYLKREFCSHNCSTSYNSGKNNPNYKRGYRIRPDGYLRNSKDKYIHRIVMEHYLGRELKSNEVVHHKDGNPNNNNIENLELTTNSEHRAEHSKSQSRDIGGRWCRRE